ncbi:hypothetical protein [Rathayibacter sp. VKM Ac-2754]|uniref:hypothetical protein n=1 Tax=Rathayibacter sp. VKM Ac-2754 TaxID=2609251 RepID=UPI00135C4808|nr:hypothetical protein [Rathayibacter sp. VKM Ac-2754]MWV58501.1 hypothetical protein [Rathayibacter sp. VKM Ac-2754]
MTTTSDRPHDARPASVRRRSVVHGAWTAPVVLAAVTAPAAAASNPAPVLTVSFSSTGGGGGYVNVTLEAADGTPLQQRFAIEGRDRQSGEWVALYRPSTDANGFFASTIPGGLAIDYSAVRITADVAGYGTLTSQEAALPFP